MHTFWEYVGALTTHIVPEKLLLIDHAYACDNVSTLYSEVKRMVFLTLLAMSTFLFGNKGILAIQTLFSSGSDQIL